MRKAVFFDLDNTLYSYDNADEAAQRALNEFCARQFGLSKEFTERKIHEMMDLLIEEMGWRQAATHDRLIRFSRFLQEIGQPIFPYAGMMYEIYWDTLIQNMKPEKGVYRFLEALKGRGYDVACATNMMSQMQYRKVQKLGMGSLLEDLITSAEVCTEKPDPEFFRFCVKKAGFQPEECVYIGDNYRLDVLGSRAAGLLGIHYQTEELARRHRQADPGIPVIRDYSDIEKNLSMIEKGSITGNGGAVRKEAATASSVMSDKTKTAESPDRPEELQNIGLERFLNEIPFGSYILRPDQTVLFWNRDAEKLLGYRSDEVVGKRCVDLSFSCSFVSEDTIAGENCPALVAYHSRQVQTMKMLIRRKDGENLLVRNTLVPLKDSRGKVTELVAVFSPLGGDSYDENFLRDIYEVATRDPLTCLPGRKYMEVCIEEELERYRRTGHTFAVLFADMDRFHDINNRYGHEVGDRLLRELGVGLRRFGRRTDRFCRWGGDEFVGLLQLKCPEEIENAAERFLQLSNHTEIIVEGQPVACQSAIGITVARKEDDVKTIVSRADEYMFLAKKRDSNQIVTDFARKA